MTASFEDERVRRQAAEAIRRALAILRTRPALAVGGALTEAFGMRGRAGRRLRAWEVGVRPRAFLALGDVLTRRLDREVEAAMTAAAERLDGAADVTDMPP